MSVRVRHPKLFRNLMAICFVNIVISAAILFGSYQLVISFRNVPATPIFPPLWFYTLFWLIGAAMILFGSLKPKEYKWARRGLVLSSMVGAFWAFGFWASLVNGTTVGISAPLFWTFYTIIVYTSITEPPINPITASLSAQDDRGNG